MNRQERRKMAKRWHVAPALVTEIERMMAAEHELVPFEPGQKVKLNVDKILSHAKVLKDNYIEYVRSHADDVFTVAKSVEGFKQIVTLEEDQTDPKWYWKTSDLIAAE